MSLVCDGDTGSGCAPGQFCSTFVTGQGGPGVCQGGTRAGGSSRGRFAVNPTTIRPADRKRPNTRMVDALPDEDLHFSGFDGSNRMFLDNDGGPTDLWFNQTGSNTIKVGADTYSFEPVLSWNPGCDTMDQGGDGIFPNPNCESKPGVGGVPGLGVSALRWKNGQMY